MKVSHIYVFLGGFLVALNPPVQVEMSWKGTYYELAGSLVIVTKVGRKKRVSSAEVRVINSEVCTLPLYEICRATGLRPSAACWPNPTFKFKRITEREMSRQSPVTQRCRNQYQLDHFRQKCGSKWEASVGHC